MQQRPPSEKQNEEIRKGKKPGERQAPSSSPWSPPAVGTSPGPGTPGLRAGPSRACPLAAPALLWGAPKGGRDPEERDMERELCWRRRGATALAPGRQQCGTATGERRGGTRVRQAWGCGHHPHRTSALGGGKTRTTHGSIPWDKGPGHCDGKGHKNQRSGSYHSGEGHLPAQGGGEVATAP